MDNNESDYDEVNTALSYISIDYTHEESTNTRFNQVPISLTEIPNWVLWRLEDRKGKKSKVPYQTNGNYASTTNESTWCSFEKAVQTLNTCNNRYSGIGIVVKAQINNQVLIGIDIDHPFNSELSQEVITHFKDTYCERSPSNKLRIFCTGSIPHSGKGITDKAIEIYDQNSPRYLTVTGNHIDGTGLTVKPCQDALDWLFNRFFSKKQDNPLPIPQNPSKTQTVNNNNVHSDDVLSDEQIIELCRRSKNGAKFDSLFNGGGNKDESSGDMALAGMLAFYCMSEQGQGVNQIDRIMRSSNRNNLKNGKWDKKHHADGRTYGQKTIERVTANLRSTYKSGFKTNRVTSKSDNASKSSVVEQPEKDWRSKLAIQVSKEGICTIKGNLYNIDVILRHDVNFQGLFGFNDFTGKVEKLKMSLAVNLREGEIEDNDITCIRNYIARSLTEVNSHMIDWGSSDILASIVNVSKDTQSFHPVRDYLNKLEWDGIERIGHFFEDHCGTAYTKYTDFVGKSLFLSLVARVMQPGCKVDTVVILEGEQGIGKSTLFRSLCKDEGWFRDSEIDLNSKDSYIALRGKWLIELAELDALNKAETTRIKSFITSQTDSYRPPYGKCDIDAPRQCCFVGTTNKSNYLKDETGNRRFLPIKCEWIDIDAIVSIRDQLWAEAVVRYNNGEKWFYSKGDQELFTEITEQQESRFEGDSWENVIESWADRHEEFSITFLAEDALNISLKDIDRRIEIRIGKILTSLGYTPVQKRVEGVKKRVYRKSTKIITI